MPVLTSVNDVEVDGVDDGQQPESVPTGGIVDDCHQLDLTCFDRSIELVSSGQSLDRFETFDPGADLGVADCDVAESHVVVVEAVEAAPDFPQEVQLTFIGHRCVVSPEASQRDEPRDFALDEVLEDGLDSWDSTIGACRARVCVRTDDRETRRLLTT